MARARLIKVYVTPAAFDLITEEAAARGESASEFGGEAALVRAAILRTQRAPDETVLHEELHRAARAYNEAAALRRKRARRAA